MSEPIAILKFNLQESQFPFFDDTQLAMLMELYPSINQASYEGCLLKSQDDSVSLGPINTPSNSEYWVRLANRYKVKYTKELRDAGQGGSISLKRMDE